MNTLDANASAFLPLVHTLADAARAHSLRYFRTPLDVLTKSDESPVTVADREAEAAMRALLQAQVPTHGILGEEHGRERLDADYVWVIDPIDGTKSFITGSPLWGTLVALLHQGRPVLGLMDLPVLGERWTAVAGQPAQVGNRRRISARIAGGNDDRWPLHDVVKGEADLAGAHGLDARLPRSSRSLVRGRS